MSYFRAFVPDIFLISCFPTGRLCYLFYILQVLPHVYHNTLTNQEYLIVSRLPIDAEGKLMFHPQSISHFVTNKLNEIRESWNQFKVHIFCFCQRRVYKTGSFCLPSI